MEGRNCDGSHITCAVYSLMHSLGFNVFGIPSPRVDSALSLSLFFILASARVAHFSSTRARGVHACVGRLLSHFFLRHRIILERASHFSHVVWGGILVYLSVSPKVWREQAPWRNKPGDLFPHR